MGVTGVQSSSLFRGVATESDVALLPPNAPTEMTLIPDAVRQLRRLEVNAETMITVDSLWAAISKGLQIACADPNLIRTAWATIKASDLVSLYLDSFDSIMDVNKEVYKGI